MRRQRITGISGISSPRRGNASARRRGPALRFGHGGCGGGAEPVGAEQFGVGRAEHVHPVPTGVKIAYKPAGQEIVVDIDLPLLDAVPELASCEYLAGKKELRHKKLTVADRSKRYQLIIAQMTLRTLRCVRRMPDPGDLRGPRGGNRGRQAGPRPGPRPGSPGLRPNQDQDREDSERVRRIPVQRPDTMLRELKGEPIVSGAHGERVTPSCGTRPAGTLKLSWTWRVTSPVTCRLR